MLYFARSRLSREGGFHQPCTLLRSCIGEDGHAFVCLFVSAWVGFAARDLVQTEFQGFSCAAIFFEAESGVQGSGCEPLAQVFHSLANFDIAGLFDVLESLGFSLKSELVNDTFKRDLIDAWMLLRNLLNAAIEESHDS